MTEAEILKIIRQEVKQQLAGLMMASIVSNESPQRSTVRRFSTSAPEANLRNIQPYGLRSRAPVGKSCLIAPVNHDPTHMNMVGHFDESSPQVTDGESVLYGADGQVVYMKTGGTVHIGTESANNPSVLGTELAALLDALFGKLDDIIAHVRAISYIGNLGAIVTGTLNDSDFAADKASLDSLKSTYVDTASTNVLSQKIFGVRGP